MKSITETEVKLALTDRASIERRLADAAFQVSAARIFESNAVYDTPDQSLRQKGTMLRLRQLDHTAILTWKGPGTPGLHKSRPELETSIGSPDLFRLILEQLGYAVHFRYDKYRVEYSEAKPGSGVVTVDETPIGDFMEIEGPDNWIDTTAARLGFSKNDYITESYGKLYLDHCKAHGLEPGNMVFESTADYSTAALQTHQ